LPGTATAFLVNFKGKSIAAAAEPNAAAIQAGAGVGKI